MRRSLLLSFLVLMLAVGSLAPHAQADQPIKRREFVWGVMAFTGQGYDGVFSPPEAPTLWLLSGETHVLTSEYTMVYYWPIDREYKPDWASLYEKVDGTLEVLGQDGRVVERVRPELYLITDLGYALAGRTHLLLGDRATAIYEEYVVERDAYLARVAQYDTDYKQYLAAKAPKSDNSELEPPSPPPPLTKALPSPGRGFPLRLEPGTYWIQLRDNLGRVVPDSRRTVTSVTPRRKSVGYSVIPETKWTVPEACNEPTDVVYYTAQGTRIYLEPFEIREYNQQAYTRMTKPQDTVSSANLWIWVLSSPLDQLQLQVWSNGRLLAQIPKKSYVVQQLPGPALGYQVEHFDEDFHDNPDFEGFEVSAGAKVRRHTVRLVREDGTVLPGSSRTLVRVSNGVPGPAYGLSLLPFILALALRWRRRQKRVHSMRDLAKAGV